MNQVSTKARNNERADEFARGQQVSKPGNAKGAGGVNLKTPYKAIATETPDGDKLNDGRLNGGTERNYNNRGPVAIPTGSTKPPANV